MLTHILVCYDGSTSAKKALHTAVNLGQREGATVTCLSAEYARPERY